jgi:hypothetical protein
VPKLAAPKLTLTRDDAWACVTHNISLPGWGSLKAGRIIAGIGEMFFALAGLFLLFAWMAKWMIRIFQSELGENLSPVPSTWIWKSGVLCIVISWIWTIITCVSLIREAKKNEEASRRNVPPRLSDLPKPPKL